MDKVVVVGGGITGCFCAYMLSKSGFSVTLIDREGIGRCATRYNPGGINPLHGPGIPGVLSDLALNSYQLHQQMQADIEKRSGMNYEGHLVSRLELAMSADEVADLENAFNLYNETEGFSAEWVDLGQLNMNGTQITDGVVRAMMTQGNGMVESLTYAEAVAKCAEQFGTRIVQAEVLDVEVSDGRAVGVKTLEGDFECDHIVMATGAWFAEASEWFGVDLPVTPLKGQLLLAELPWGQLPCHVMHGMTGLYATPSGQVWIGGTQEAVGFDDSTTAEGREKILTAVERFIPDIRNLKVVEQVAGFRPVTPDRLPVIGRIPGFENALIASGAGVKGMLLSVGMAEAVVEILTTQNELKSLSHFSPNRFS